MPSTFLGLNTGLSGLTYFQSALNTTSHNISNVNTEGYSKQQVTASASDPLSLTQSYGMMGTGVTGQSIDRLRNVYYDNKYWNASAKYTKYETEFGQLSQLQTYMNEMSSDAGYTAWISKMSMSLQDLANDPSNYNTRISYTLTADSFTDMINELAYNYQSTQKNINDEIELAVSDINSLSKQIYQLTQQIINIELKGGAANDLRDKRDVCIDKLSTYGTVDVEERSIMFGTGLDSVEANAQTMMVRFNNEILVDELEYKELMVVPRNQNINLNDAEGLVDIYWKCADETPGDKFDVIQYGGKLAGLFDIRDGNNGEYFSGTVTEATEATGTDKSKIKVHLDESIHIDKLNIPAQGSIVLNGKEYFYDGWTADYDADGFLNDFEFQNMTMYDSNRVEVSARFPAGLVSHKAEIGEKNSEKGIPYYMARLNELVRTVSSYMNKFTTAGVDAEGRDGLDMFTAQMVDGGDFVLKGTMTGTGKLKANDQSYYRLTALNWELNQDWKVDPSRVVVSYKEDIEQGDIEARPIVDAIKGGLTDVSLFQQGTLSQYLQAMTTNLAVDISKKEVFMNNQDDIKYNIDNQRKSVSGVDQNEEATDLVKFQNLYNLASKVISVLNEVYDKLINQTGV